MRFDVTLTNGRIDTIEVPGVDDILEMLTLADDQREADGWISARLSNGSRALIRVAEIVSIADTQE